MEFSEQGWRRLAPNLATLLTLVLGLGAIEAARFGDTGLGLRFVLLAILADGVDGALARRWGVTSNLGSQLDSLADLVAFGIAPGMLFAAQHPEVPGPLRFGVIAMVALSGAWRLARFQSEPGRRDFAGLPITVGGPLFALAVAGFQPAGPEAGLLWAFALGALMVSRVPYLRFNSGRLGRIAPVLGAAFVIVLPIDGFVAVFLAQVLLTGYVVVGLVRAMSLGVMGGWPVAGGRGRGE